MQRLITKEIESRVPPLYAQDGKGGDAVIFAKFFCPKNGWRWYMTEYDPETKEAFGWVEGCANELGYFSIREFEDLNRQMWVGVERDLHWPKGRTLNDLPSYSKLRVSISQ